MSPPARGPQHLPGLLHHPLLFCTFAFCHFNCHGLKILCLCLTGALTYPTQNVQYNQNYYLSILVVVLQNMFVLYFFFSACAIPCLVLPLKVCYVPCFCFALSLASSR